MDYSLLVGIHDCSIPPSPEDEGADSWGEEGNGFVSGDEVTVDTPGPVSPNLGMYTMHTSMLTTIHVSRKVSNLPEMCCAVVGSCCS